MASGASLILSPYPFGLLVLEYFSRLTLESSSIIGAFVNGHIPLVSNGRSYQKKIKIKIK